MRQAGGLSLSHKQAGDRGIEGKREIGYSRSI